MFEEISSDSEGGLVVPGLGLEIDVDYVNILVIAALLEIINRN